MIASMKRLAPVLAALTIACGGDDDPKPQPGAQAGATNDSCTVTLSGALNETKDCLMFINQVPSNVNSNAYVGGGTFDGLFGFNIFDVPVATGTYRTDETFSAEGLAVVRTPMAAVPSQRWVLNDNVEGVVDTGTYEMRITAVSASASGSGVTQWPVDGTLDATYTAAEESGAMGTVTVHMEF